MYHTKEIGANTNAMKIPKTTGYAIFVLSALACASCGLFGGRTDRSYEAGAASAVSNTPTLSDYKADLRARVRERIKNAAKNAAEQRAALIRRKPYFFKEYEVYPGGPDKLKLTIQETESRSAPLIADVVLAKQRYATRLHRNRKAAQADTHFLRDTGTETITYELRGGRWIRVGSLFVASKSEEQIKGEWAPVEADARRTAAAEQEEKNRGWLSRTWSRITGR